MNNYMSHIGWVWPGKGLTRVEMRNESFRGSRNHGTTSFGCGVAWWMTADPGGWHEVRCSDGRDGGWVIDWTLDPIPLEDENSQVVRDGTEANTTS
jgi:hypothetical protein